jgi:hypothetical protein
MDGIGDLVGGLGRSLGGLMDGALRAVGDALHGAIASLQSLLPGPWLPIAAVAALVILGLLVFRR